MAVSKGGLERQALHAFRLAFGLHPVSKKPLVLYAPLPQDMAAALDLWGLRYNTLKASDHRSHGTDGALPLS